MSRLKLFALCLVTATLTNPLFAEDVDPVEYVTQSCSAEIENYCSQVTLGEGRLMACFYAHEEKLTVGCVNALYDVAVALEQAVNALVYVATNCETDIDTYCSETEPGEGRILNCLSASRESISEQCSTVLSELEE